MEGSEFIKIQKMLKNARDNGLLEEVVFYALTFVNKHPEATPLQAVTAGIEFYDLL